MEEDSIYIDELQHWLAVYFSFKPQNNQFTDKEDALELMFHIKDAYYELPLEESIRIVLKKGKSNMISRKNANSWQDYEALVFASNQIARINRIYAPKV